MCTEWMHANGYLVPPPENRPAPSSLGPPELAKAKQGRSITSDDITSFKAACIETCIESDEGGPPWLVSEYTGADRHELSVEHAATMAALCVVFPDARLLTLRVGGRKVERAEASRCTGTSSAGEMQLVRHLRSQVGTFGQSCGDPHSVPEPRH